MQIGNKVELLETYIVCHDTFITKGTQGTITDIQTFCKNGTYTDVAWIDVGLKNSSGQTILAKSRINNLKLINNNKETTMLKVQIKNKQNEVSKKSFAYRMDLCWDLKFILDFPLHKNDRETLSNKIYDLNVGETYKVFGYEFKLLSKSKSQKTFAYEWKFKSAFQSYEKWKKDTILAEDLGDAINKLRENFYGFQPDPNCKFGGGSYRDTIEVNFNSINQVK